jgi:hypothetical protein
LTTKVSLLRVHSYDPGELLFDNALTSTTVIVYRKSAPERQSSAVLSTGGTAASPSHRSRVQLGELQQSERWTFSALNPTRMPIGPVVGDFFSVGRGVATGANRFFVLSDKDLETFEVDPSWVRPLVPRARTLSSPFLNTSGQGLPDPFDGKWLIDTDLPLFDIMARSPKFGSYLQRLEREVGGRSLIARRTLPWRQQTARVAPILFVYMAKKDSVRPRFIRNISDAVHLNNYLGLFPRTLPGLLDEPIDLDRAHQALLAIGPDVLAEYGRTYGKNLVKLEPREIESLPLDM